MSRIGFPEAPERLPRVGRWERGYDAAAVRRVIAEPPASVEQVRAVRFPLQRGGVRPAVVDRWLAGMEDAWADRERASRLETLGRVQWRREVEETADLVMGRLQRPAGARFRPPEGPKVKGYFAPDVDRFCDELVETFRVEDRLDPQLVRSAVFRVSSASRSYDEAQVDAFLDTALDLIHDLRS